jgi:hypothetical protein
MLQYFWPHTTHICTENYKFLIISYRCFSRPLSQTQQERNRNSLSLQQLCRSWWGGRSCRRIFGRWSMLLIYFSILFLNDQQSIKTYIMFSCISGRCSTIQKWYPRSAVYHQLFCTDRRQDEAISYVLRHHVKEVQRRLWCSK